VIDNDTLRIRKVIDDDQTLRNCETSRQLQQALRAPEEKSTSNNQRGMQMRLARKQKAPRFFAGL